MTTTDSHSAEPDIRPRVILTDPHHLIAFGFGSGLAPVAPGTAGTLAAVIPYLLMVAYLSPWAYVAVIVVSAVFGFWVCDVSSKKLGVHDHGGIVWDEFVGFWITMLPVVFAGESNLWWLVGGFVAFRVFDVLKPFPIGMLDKRVGGGVGIMLDDLIAGVNAAVVLLAVQWYLSGRLDHLF